jgi:hypothetical protein
MLLAMFTIPIYLAIAIFLSWFLWTVGTALKRIAESLELMSRRSRDL